VTISAVTYTYKHEILEGHHNFTIWLCLQIITVVFCQQLPSLCKKGSHKHH